jgi:hypothetical protein
LAHSTPGAPWQLKQPRSENARAPACTVAGSSSEIGGLSVACRAMEAKRIFESADLTNEGSSRDADTS